MRCRGSMSAKPICMRGKIFQPLGRLSRPCRNWRTRTWPSERRRDWWSGSSSRTPRSISGSLRRKRGSEAISQPDRRKLFRSGFESSPVRFSPEGESRGSGTPSDTPSGSGRAMARTGLRMMPTFPSSPLSFRTAGFPQYGCKAGLSDSAFTPEVPVKPAPGMPGPTLALRLPFVHPDHFSLFPLCVGRDGDRMHRHSRSSTPLPQRPSLRSGLCCPSPSSLMRPHASHSRAHRDFTAVRLIPDAFAVPVRLGDPGVVPCFRYPFCLDMSPSATPGSSTAAYTQFLRRQRWPSSRGKRLGTSNIPTIRFPWGGISELYYGLLALRVRVGIMIAQDPLYRSGQAAFPHPALALGVDDQPLRGVGMNNANGRQPMGD